MVIRNRVAVVKSFLLVVVSFAAFACGGGGGSAVTGSTKNTTVSGVASKGIIVNGVVKIYAVNSDSTLRLLAITTTDTSGRYEANVGAYTGPVLVEASGSYTDEATGMIKTVTSDSPLRAAVPYAEGLVNMAVTPLTELAVVRAGPAALSATSILSANALISDIFKVNIVDTLPVAASELSLPSSTTSAAQKDYTIALAAVSQMMFTKGLTLASVVGSLNSSISGKGMTTTAAQNFQDSLAQFVSSPNNMTGVNSINQTNLAMVGGQTASYLIATSSSQTPLSIKAIQIVIELPAGSGCRKEANGTALPSSLSISGITQQASIYAAKCSPATLGSPATVEIGILSSSGFGAGQFATLILDLEPGVEKPAPATLTISTFTAITDIDGRPNPAISPIISLQS